MTYARREEIFSKDVITVGEFAEIMELDKCTASTNMVAAKELLLARTGKLRCNQKGKMHVQDFIDFYDVDIRRYMYGVVKQEAQE